jgi:hypothetical protein
VRRLFRRVLFSFSTRLRFCSSINFMKSTSDCFNFRSKPLIFTFASLSDMFPVFENSNNENFFVRLTFRTRIVFCYKQVGYIIRDLNIAAIPCLTQSPRLTRVIPTLRYCMNSWLCLARNADYSGIICLLTFSSFCLLTSQLSENLSQVEMFA